MKRARPDVKEATLAELSKIYKGSFTVNGGLQLDDLLYTAKNTQRKAVYKLDGKDTSLPVLAEDWADFAPMDKLLAKIGLSDLGDKISRQ